MADTNQDCLYPPVASYRAMRGGARRSSLPVCLFCLGIRSMDRLPRPGKFHAPCIFLFSKCLKSVAYSHPLWSRFSDRVALSSPPPSKVKNPEDASQASFLVFREKLPALEAFFKMKKTLQRRFRNRSFPARRRRLPSSPRRGPVNRILAPPRSPCR